MFDYFSACSCEHLVHMKFLNRFMNKASDWILNQTGQSNVQFTIRVVKFLLNF